MAACGVPTHHENHVSLMVEFAKGMLEDLAEYNKNAKIHFNIRIGLNCGPVTAGVIGKTKFIYDVWGNTVNVASRMESTGLPMKIHVTETTKDQTISRYQYSANTEIDVKGKGVMKTFFL